MALTNKELEKIREDYAHFISANTPDSEPADGLYGWICPKCGAVMSPFQSYCIKCSGNWEITSDAGISYNIPISTKCNGGNE